MSESPYSFAYLFERFPSFVQTFVYREAEEMIRQGTEPLLVSVREPEDAPEVRHQTGADVFYLPHEKMMRLEVDERRKSLTRKQRRSLSHWRGQRDSGRVIEALWLGRKLKTLGIQHVHAHFGGLAARTAWHMHHLWGITYSFTGHANDIFCENQFPVSNAMLVKNARFIVTETDFARLWMEKKYRQCRGRVFRIFNGIQMSGFPKHHEAAGVPRIVSVGRYVEKKGFPTLIKACALLKEREVPFHCEIIGDGPLKDQLAQLISENGLEDQVVLAGPKEQKAVRQSLASARVFALACTTEADGGSDNLPTVIMEAMACGTPVISTRLAGVPEMIDHGKSGLLVSPGNVKELAHALEQLLTNQELAERLGKEALVSACARFGVENSALSLIRLLAKHGRVAMPDAVIAEHPELQLSWWKRTISRPLRRYLNHLLADYR